MDPKTPMGQIDAKPAQERGDREGEIHQAQDRVEGQGVCANCLYLSERGRCQNARGEYYAAKRAPAGSCKKWAQKIAVVTP